MRICVLTTSFPRRQDDEASVFVGRLVSALSRSGVTGCLVVPYDRSEKTREQVGGIEIFRYKYGLFSRGRLAFGSGIIPNLKARPWLIFQAPMLLFRMWLYAFNLRGKYDLLQANWILSALPAYFIKMFVGTPYVITLRGEDVRVLSRQPFKTLLAPAIKSADYIVSVNKGFLEDIGRAYSVSDKKLHFIPNGVEVPAVAEDELQVFKKQKGISDRLKYLLFIGTIIPRKRLEALIKLVAEPKMSSFSLIACGRTLDSAYLKTLNELAKELKCEERVRFEGSVAPSKIPHYLSICRFYASASEFEGRSNAMLEALAAGRVVIASDIAAHRELIVDQESGLLFDVNRISELSSRLLEIDSEPERYQALARQGRFLSSSYSWQACADSYIELFNRALTN